MNRQAGLWLLAALVALPATAHAAASSPDRSLAALAAHGLVAGYQPGVRYDSAQNALFAAGAIGRIEAGDGNTIDVQNAQRLIDAMPEQLDALGVRTTNLRNDVARMQTVRSHSVSAVRVDFEVLPQQAAARYTFVQSGPLAAQIRGVSLMQPHVHALQPRTGATGALALTPAFARNTLHDGYVHFGTSPTATADHSPITLALFGIGQPALTLPAAVTTAAPAALAQQNFGSAFDSGVVPAAPGTPVATPGALAGMSFQVHAVGPVSGAVTATLVPAFAQLPPVTAFSAMPAQLASAPVLAPAFGSSALSPASLVRPSPGELAQPAPSGFGSAFYNALVPNSSGVEFHVSAPVRLGGVAFRGNLSAAHLQETAPNAYGTMPASAATTERLGAGTTFDVRAFGRRVSLDLGTAYERLTRDDRSTLTYQAYTPPAYAAPAAASSSFVPPDLGAPGYVNPNYVNVTRRSLNASAAVPLSHTLSLNLQYNAQYYSGSYSTLTQNIDERKDSYLGNLTYQIPRSASAIVFSAKQYRYRDAFVPAYNVTQNRADLNFTVKF